MDSADGMKVLVLGGGGFVGSAVMRELADRGIDAVAGVRRPPRETAGMAWRLCDATDGAAMLLAVADADCVVNAVLSDARTMLAATRNLCSAARRTGLRRIVHVSSMSVYGNVSGVTAEDAVLAAKDRYGLAKIACEREIARFVAQGGEAVILRPGIVYGPDGEQWIGRIGRMLRDGRLGDLGAHGDGVCNLAYVDDVGAACVAALVRPGVAGLAINLGSRAPLSWNAYFMRLGRALGVVPVRRIGGRRLWCEARLVGPWLQAARRLRVLPDPMTPSLLRLFESGLLLDQRRAESLLCVPGTLEDVGIATSAAWLLRKWGLGPPAPVGPPPERRRFKRRWRGGKAPGLAFT